MDKQSSKTILGSALLISALTVAAAYAMFFCYALSQNQAIEYEGPCLWASTQIARGLNPYPLSTLSQSPYTVIIYPPFYFIVCALFEHGEPNYLWPRLISILASLFTAVFYYKFLRRYCHKRTSIGGTVLLMSFMAIWLWSAKGRVDQLSLALSALSLWLYALSQGTKTPVLTLIASALALSLATMTKQPSALIAPALILDMLLARRIKDAAIFASGFALALLSMLGLAQVATQGGFIAHMRFATHMPFEWRYLSERLALMYVDWPKFILTLLALPLSVIYREKLSNNPLRLALLLLLTTLPVTFYTAGTAYSNVNHFLVLLLPLPLFIATMVESTAQAPKMGRVTALMYGSTLLLSGALLLFLATALFSPATCQRKLALNPAVEPAELKRLMQGQLVLSEDGGYGPLFGAISEPVDITTFIQVLGLDGSQARDMLKNVEAKKYAVVVINHQEFTGERKMAQWDKATIEAVRRNYRLLGQANGNCEVQDVYLPK
ncbi:MAG: glycosyltransferase family 39 protein [Candidatus Obscuribacter sp.]|nr:glycosyltransferase family 39 protein [Candidatus Obscuribacter sp.]